MASMREQIARLACSGLDVLIRGESGTGKELVAAALHRLSERSSGQMVSVNMAAIPPTLAAATLFGSARGAYTGATRANEGYFNQARGGTLFLDEIGDTPREIQPQLLRALQEREIQAVGGAVRKADVRVVSATDAALDGAGCDFKAALRHRLGGGEIRLLALRQHPEDIGELLWHFLASNCQRLGRSALLPAEHSPGPEIAAWADLFHRMLGYDWPGNVRELANFASQVAVASEQELTLPDNIRQALELRAGPELATSGHSVTALPRRNMRHISAEEFDSALVAAAYEVAQVARQLGVSRQSVYRRLDESEQYRLAGQVPQSELERVLTRLQGDAAATARHLKVSLSSLRARLRDTDLAWY
jgi:two-component system nitrogen regulation response regulator GlnG